MSRSVKCPVAGCPGVRTIETDGCGGTRESCACCEKRAAYKEANIPTTRRMTCLVCGGAFQTKGRVTRYCLACRPIVHRVSARKTKLKEREKKAAGAPLRVA